MRTESIAASAMPTEASPPADIGEDEATTRWFTTEFDADISDAIPPSPPHPNSDVTPTAPIAVMTRLVAESTPPPTGTLIRCSGGPRAATGKVLPRPSRPADGLHASASSATGGGDVRAATPPLPAKSSILSTGLPSALPPGPAPRPEIRPKATPHPLAAPPAPELRSNDRPRDPCVAPPSDGVAACEVIATVPVQAAGNIVAPSSSASQAPPLPPLPPLRAINLADAGFWATLAEQRRERHRRAILVLVAVLLLAFLILTSLRGR